ncbi:MAG: hydrogenase maturation protease [Campylobacteraceae bacterium]
MKKAFLAVGNTLRGDDGIASELGKLIEESGDGWRVFYGEDVPENEFHNIKKYEPDLIIVADAVTGMKVGVVNVLDLSSEIDYIYSTHNIPTPVLISYLRNFCQNVFFLGLGVDILNVLEINPELSNEAKETAKKGLVKIKEIDKIFS